MKSLIWKEWRETRWIAIGFLLICLLTSICWKIALPGHEQGWHAGIWSLLAVVLGARAFAGEKQATTIQFLAAQPLRKTHLWALKAAWGFGVLLVIVGISSVLDYLLMRADPFYTALHLLVPVPFSWLFLALLTVYAVALLSSTVSDKTVLAVGFAVVTGAIVACGVALIDRWNPFFYQFLNESWGIPLALFWFSAVVLAGSFLIVAWREVWPNYQTAVKRAAIGVGVGTVVVLLILSSANVPPAKITGIAELNGDRTEIVFSPEVNGKRLTGWKIDIDGENFTKATNPPVRHRKHPALAAEGAEALRNNMVIMPIHRGENAGGYLIEKLERDRFHLIPRRVRTTIQPIEGATLTWLGAWDQMDTPTGVFDQFYFVEELPSGERYVRVTYPEGDKAGRTARIGRLIAVSPNAKSFILTKPDVEAPEGKVRLTLFRREVGSERLAVPLQSQLDVDREILDTLSFVTEDFVQYKRGENLHLTLADLLGKQYFEHPHSKWKVPLQTEVPRSIVVRGPNYVRRVAENLAGKPLRSWFGLSKAKTIIEILTPEAPTGMPKRSVEALLANAEDFLVLDGIAAQWGAELPEELFDEAIFWVPKSNQIIYLRKDDDQRSGLYVLDLASDESTKILDDIDVTVPAVPKALIAPIMEDYFAFVRDAKTIWTYRDGDLKQIFPPQR